MNFIRKDHSSYCIKKNRNDELRIVPFIHGGISSVDIRLWSCCRRRTRKRPTRHGFVLTLGQLQALRIALDHLLQACGTDLSKGTDPLVAKPL